MLSLLQLLFLSSAAGLQQSFLVKPHDIRVGLGGTGIIPCEVSNIAGRVQWTKDGLTLGYDRSIPGIPRYRVLGSPDSGEFSLEITNVSLEDDADFECQVGPANYNNPIRANAHLYILLPPTKIEILNIESGSKVEIKENTELELTCKVWDSKPKATILWYRKGSLLSSETEVLSESEPDAHGKMSVSSKITLRPSSLDNGVPIACEADHPALATQNMRASVILSVLFPPGPPEIQGHVEGETIRMGQTVSLICVSHGGNPLAEVVWYRSDVQIDFSYYTTGRESRNIYTFVASSDDNNKVYRCDSKNSQSPEVLKSTITLAVQFPPDAVKIEGPPDAKVGESLTFECSTSNSNPPASIQWVIDSRSVSDIYTHTIESENGGWITKSNISVLVNPLDRNKLISCYGINTELGETIVQTHMVSVLYPPGLPSITGVGPENILEEGVRKRLTCISMAGNPLATLTWYRGSSLISGTETITSEGDFAKSELLLTANYSDNGLAYKCEASSPATKDTGPLMSKIILRVRFKPSFVSISLDPKEPKAGKKAILICKSSSSNPTSVIHWRRNNVPFALTDSSVQEGNYGGNISTNILEISVRPEDDGAVYICEARNNELGQSANDAITLNVKYAPVFSSDVQDVWDVVEGESIFINITATGNPNDLSYKWLSPSGASISSLQDSRPETRIVSLGNALNITRATVEDDGKYKLKVSNSEGKSKLRITVNVLHAPTIVFITHFLLVRSGETAHFECIAEGKPLEETSFSWIRDDFEFEKRTKTSFGTSSLHLTVYNVSTYDSGEFFCRVDNGIGVSAYNSSFLLVRQAPVMDTSASIGRAASDKGQNAILICRASGAPNISFSWSRKGSLLRESEDGSSRYVMKTSSVTKLTWMSELHVLNVSSFDYGSYDCIAQNEEGLTRHSVLLNVTSKPDVPFSLQILNITYHSVTLTWENGFNGGYPQFFRIRYHKDHSHKYQYVDVFQNSNSVFEVQDLKLGTHYSFSIKAFNHLGDSEYTQDKVEVTTLTYTEGMVKPEEKDVERNISRGIIIAITLLVGLLLLCNVVLISCYVRRRQNHKLGENSSQSTKSGTIELYTGSSVYNETISGETSSSLSEKSYLSAIPIIEESHFPKSSSTYLIETPSFMSQQYHQQHLPIQHLHNHHHHSIERNDEYNSGSSYEITSPIHQPINNGLYVSPFEVIHSETDGHLV